MLQDEWLGCYSAYGSVLVSVDTGAHIKRKSPKTVTTQKSNIQACVVCKHGECLLPRSFGMCADLELCVCL